LFPIKVNSLIDCTIKIMLQAVSIYVGVKTGNTA